MSSRNWLKIKAKKSWSYLCHYAEGYDDGADKHVFLKSTSNEILEDTNLIIIEKV